MRTIATGLYLLVVGACVFLAWRRSSEPEGSIDGWHASRNLTAGRQLTVDDIRRPDGIVARLGMLPADSVIGRHIAKAVKVEDVINPDSLLSRPVIATPAADSAIVTFSLTAPEVPTLTAVLDPGTSVRVCSGDKATLACAKAPLARIVAIHRDFSSTPIGWMTLATLRDSTQKLLGQLALAGRMFVVAAPELPKHSAQKSSKQSHVVRTR